MMVIATEVLVKFVALAGLWKHNGTPYRDRQTDRQTEQTETETETEIDDRDRERQRERKRMSQINSCLITLRIISNIYNSERPRVVTGCYKMNTIV